MKLTYDMFYGDRQLNAFMHAADVFEKGKQLANFQRFDMEFELEEDSRVATSEDIQKIFDHLREATTKEYNLVFLSIRAVDGVATNEFEPYIKEGVQSISDGKGWGMFHEMLKRIGYDVEHTQFMQVTKAKLKI